MYWNGNPCGCQQHHRPEDDKKECSRSHCCPPKHEKDCDRDHKWSMEKYENDYERENRWPMVKQEEEKKECCRPCCCPPKEKPECPKPECPPKEQKHNHEVQGSVMIAEPQEEPHNHRFATVSGEAIFVGNNDHVHEVKFDTDFYEDHYHEFEGRTSGAVWVGDRHVHYLKSVTEESDGHVHEFRVATLIDNPIGE